MGAWLMIKHTRQDRKFNINISQPSASEPIPRFTSTKVSNQYGEWTCGSDGGFGAVPEWEPFKLDNPKDPIRKYAYAGQTVQPWVHSFLVMPQGVTIRPTQIYTKTQNLMGYFYGFNNNTHKWEIIKKIDNAKDNDYLYDMNTTKYYSAFRWSFKSTDMKKHGGLGSLAITEGYIQY